MKKTAVVVCAVLGFIISFYAAVLPARAATVNVSTGAGFTSAVAAAASGDTINITQDVTITAEVIINKSLTINGQGHILSVPVPGLTDSGVYNTSPSNFRAFTTSINGGTVAINDLTVRGGKTAGSAAGINNINGTRLILTRVNITNSWCSGAAGGLHNNDSTVYLIDSSISRNAASSGGGFRSWNGGKMYIENSTISENRSLSANGGGGGGENGSGGLVDPSYLYINNSTFANNKSTELGGAINNGGEGVLYVLNSTFTGNVAYGHTSYGFEVKGGAIALNNSTATLVNSVFAYNYWNSSETEVPAYTLNDVFRYSGNLATAYNCIFQAPDDASVTHDDSNLTNTNPANGSDDSIFTGGATAKVLGPDGTELGTNTVYQPFLVKASGAYVNTAAIKTGSTVIGQGIKTGFSDVSGSEVVGYYNGLSWVNVVGSNPVNFEVLVDQNHVSRAATPAVGATETGIGSVYMLKVNSATGGTVNGGGIYGDVYASGTSVSLTGLPNNGYSFTRWDYVLGGEGIASTANPYTLTLDQNTTLAPVFTALTGYTVTYMGNGNTSGTVPAVQTAEASATMTISDRNTLVKSGFGFSGWNTRADGSGTAYAVGSTYTSASTNLVLYAQYQSPLAPTGATATVVSSSTINLSWTDNSSNETGFIPGSSLDNDNFTDMDSTTDTSQGFTELSANTRYWFRVAATNGAGDSDYVAASPKYTLAIAPTTVSATANDSVSITVSWSGGAASTYRASHAGGNSDWIAADSYSFSGLACNTAYTFSVKGKNGDGVETESVSVSQSTLACPSGAFVPSSKPDVSNLKINNAGGGAILFENLPSDVIQLAVSTGPDFSGTSWEGLGDKDELFKKYSNAFELYVRFRNAAGGVSDTVVYCRGTALEAPREGDIVKTNDNFDVYIIKYYSGKQFKRLILSPSVFESYQHLKWENIKIISQSEMDLYTTSILARETDDTVIYELTPLGDTGKRNPLDPGSSYDPDSVYEINREDRDSYVLSA